jgi:ParB/RepB/Spo0J family partition protein
MNNQSNTRTQDPQYRERDRDRVDLDVIVIPATHRVIDHKKVEELAQSMGKLGLINPIVVLEVKDGDTTLHAEVVAGGHRVEAARSLEWAFIDAIWIYDKTEARLITITENLHRNELTALERDEQIAEWIELTERKQVVTDKLSETREGRPGVPKSVVTELGIHEKDAQRAVKVAGLSPEAKDEARTLGVDDNRTALLDAAKYEKPEDQVAALIASHDNKVITAAAKAIRAVEGKERHAARIARLTVISEGNTEIPLGKALSAHLCRSTLAL